MKIKLHALLAAATLLLPAIAFAQDSIGESGIEQAKQLSATTGRPILAVAGEAQN